MIENLVLGAGIAGLSFADEMSSSKTVIFESEDHYGGLCNSFDIEGFIFDTAVHLSFTNNEEVRRNFDKVQYYMHKPIAYNFYDSKWIKHPIQNNLYKLNTDEKIKCITSFINRPKYKELNNYEDWLLSSYGEEITKRFSNVYTKKYWAEEAEKLSTTWIKPRMKKISIEEVLLGAIQEDTGENYYAKEMRYPKSGGFKSFLNNIAKNIKINYHKKAVKISLSEKRVYFDDDTSYEYENLISSLPMPELIKLIDNVPDNILEMSKELLATSFYLVSIGFNKPDIPKYLWFYIYDEDILAARAYSPSLKSPYNVPSGCSSLQFEIYYSNKKGLKESDAEICLNTKKALKKMNICEEEDIRFIDCRKFDYANVIFFKGMEEIRDSIRSYLDENKIISIGRFGEWKYFWSDESFISGKKAARKLKNI